MVEQPAPDSLANIERDLRALIHRAHALGVAEGRRDVVSSFLQFANVATPAAAPKPAIAPDKRARAPHGQVRDHVRRVVEAHPNGIAQTAIIGYAASVGLEIKPSSMRMALPALEKAGIVVQRDGKWFPKGNGAPDGAPPETR